MHPPPSTPARLATKALCSRYNLRGSAALRATKRSAVEIAFHKHPHLRSAVGIALHILPRIRRRHHVPLQVPCPVAIATKGVGRACEQMWERSRRCSLPCPKNEGFNGRARRHIVPKNLPPAPNHWFFSVGRLCLSHSQLEPYHLPLHCISSRALHFLSARHAFQNIALLKPQSA